MTCLPFYNGIQTPWNYVFFILNMTSSVVCSIGNALVIYSLLSRKHLRTPQNVYIVSLAASDLFGGFFAQPIYGIYNAFFPDKNLCRLELYIVFVSATCCATSILLLCAIAWDRLQSITAALRLRPNTAKYYVINIVLCYVFGLLTGATFMLSDGWTQYLGFATFSAIELGSFIVILYTYIRIHHLIKEQGKKIIAVCNTTSEHNNQSSCLTDHNSMGTLTQLDPVDDTKKFKSIFQKTKLRQQIKCRTANEFIVSSGPVLQDENPSSQKSNNPHLMRSIMQRERSSNTTILIIITIYVIMWFPFMVVLMFGFYYQVCRLPFPTSLRAGFMWTAVFTYVNGTINPFIYAIRYHYIKREIVRVISNVYCASNRVDTGQDNQQIHTTSSLA